MFGELFMKNRLLQSVVCISCIAPFMLFAGADIQEDEQMQQALNQNARPRVIMPNAGQRVENGADVYIDAAYLYLKATQDNMSFAKDGVSTATSGDATLTKGEYKLPGFHYNSGFQATLGVGVGYDGWDLRARYTWYDHTREKTRSEASHLVPTLDFSLPSSVTQADGEWAFRLNNIDFDLGRDFYVSQYISLRPAIGLKSAWQRQEFNVDYFWTNSAQSALETSLHQTAKSFGIGLRTALQAGFQFNKNFSIVANSALNILSTNKKSEATNLEKPTTPVGAAGTISQHIEQKATTMQPVAELQMGLQYDVWFLEDAYHLGINVGWLMQSWMHNNFFSTAVAEGQKGDLSLNGVLGRLRFDF